MERHRWFALMTAAKAEAGVVKDLERMEVDAFAPTYIERKGHTRRYFPRYVFVHKPDAVPCGIVSGIPGVSTFIRFGGDPVEIPPGVMTALQQAIYEAAWRQGDSPPRPVYRVGQRVRFSPDTAFGGLVARIMEIKDLDKSSKIKIWLEAFGRELSTTDAELNRLAEANQ